jgi:hypothetical protein
MDSRAGLIGTFATAGLAVALVFGASATAAPKGDYVATPIGSTFTYALHATGSFGSGDSQVTSKKEQRTWEGKTVEAIVSPLGVTLVNQSDAGWVAQLAPDGKVLFTFDPPLAFHFPLEVGKTWTTSYKLTVQANNQTSAFDATFKVEAYEDVTVPAGTFKVFRISYIDTRGSDNMEYFIPDLGIFAKRSWTRTDKAPAGPGTVVRELVSYSLPK